MIIWWDSEVQKDAWITSKMVLSNSYGVSLEDSHPKWSNLYATTDNKPAEHAVRKHKRMIH